MKKRYVRRRFLTVEKFFPCGMARMATQWGMEVRQADIAYVCVLRVAWPQFTKLFLGRRGPGEMFVEKVEGALAVDAVSALEEFDFGFVREAELRVEPADFTVF